MTSIDAQALAEPRAVERELSLEDALALANDLQRGGDYAQARRLYDAVLEHWPDQPDALHFLGVLEHAEGRSDEALALMRRAIAGAPDEPGPWNNLGNVLAELQRLDEAADAYRRSAAIDPESPRASDAHHNLGAIHRKRGRLAEAEAACRRALVLRPDFADAWYQLSRVLIERGAVREGLLANGRAIALWPRHLQARDQVIRALVLLGQIDQAAELYREWLTEEPDNPVVQHQLAACLQHGAPARASDAYVETVFDSFATSFDAKLASLGYRAPQLVADALREALPAPARQFDIADLGCGTGLVGPLLRGWARRLAGCDLSVGMLRQAKRRGVYDVLHKAELVHYLRTQPQAFDVVVSADTLCYFGDLTEVAHAARRSLRAGGWFAFTVEALGDDAAESFALLPQGRYAHGRRHVESALEAAGFALRVVRAETLRQEAGQPVAGWLVLASAARG